MREQFISTQYFPDSFGDEFCLVIDAVLRQATLMRHLKASVCDNGFRTATSEKWEQGQRVWWLW